MFRFFIILLFFFQCKSSVKDYTKTPILFIHGHGLKAKHWDSFIKFFEESGHPSQYLYAIDLKPKNGSNILAAEEQIAPAVEEFIIKVNREVVIKLDSTHIKNKIDIISHGMGALSARWYAAKIRPDRVRLWLSLAGTNHGTSEFCSYFGQGSEDCCPPFAESPEQSHIQYVLNGKPCMADTDETPYGIGIDTPGTQTVNAIDHARIIYLTVRTFPNKWIKPEESAVLDGAGGIDFDLFEGLLLEETTLGNILIKEKMGHMQLLYSAKVHYMVYDLIRQVDFLEVTP